MSASTLRHRPIFGGVFGRGRYALATMPCVANGLHAVRYLVIEPSAGAVIAIADGKREALAHARDVLRAAEAFERLRAAELGQHSDQIELWPRGELPSPVTTRPRPVSKRRRVIYEKCRGQCHYCAAPLQLAGPWHVEHMLPRALGGADDASNLVAACVPCNLAKSDRTAIEFVTARNVPPLEIPRDGDTEHPARG